LVVLLVFIAVWRGKKGKKGWVMMMRKDGLEEC